ncbi:MAG TPA: 5-oxoprolinase subunit PxpA, partial [Rhodoferax sp.]
MKIDLNSDLGESLGAWRMGDDAAMLGIVSSANVACGFHAGDPAGMLRTLRQAKANGVVVGAHVAYRDLVGFGRRNMDVESADLIADVIYQIGALQGLAAAAGTSVRYVKPHGALYNTIAHDARQASDVITAIREIDPS